MGLDEDLNKALEDFKKSDEQTFTAKVLSVDKALKTCEVEDVDGLDYDEVRLSASVDELDKVVKFPAVGSSVLVSLIGDDIQTLYVVSFSEVESIEGIIGNTSFTINEGLLKCEIEDTKLDIDNTGFKIVRDGENLKEVLSDYIAQFGKLCDELSKVVVSVGVTPNVPIITQIKQEVTNNINNRLGEILK